MTGARLVLGGLLAFAMLESAPLRAADGRSGLQVTLPSATDSDFIVEFRDRPLFAHPELRASGNRPAHAAALRLLEARAARFRTDLRAIEARFAGASASSMRNTVKPFVITHTFDRVFAGASIHAPSAAIPAIERLDYVAHVWRDATAHALLEKSVPRIRADEVWTAHGTRGAGVVVAIIDTGIDYLHPALGGRFGPGGKVIGGTDFVNGDEDPMDDNGHGTFVAGIVGALGSGVIGVAPDVRLLAFKVLDANGSGRESDILSAIERTVDPNGDADPSDRADVANLSLGCPETSEPLLQAIETATAAGVVFTIASGNEGGFFSVSCPAIAPSAIAVGATDDAGFVTNFSSSGPAGSELAIKPEVVAPGSGIASAASGGGGLTTQSGTSASAPHVAGVAALIRAVHPEWSPAEVKAAIVTTAEPVPGDLLTHGGGRVDAMRAIETQLVASPPTLPFGRDDSTQPVWTATRSVRLKNVSAEPLKVGTSTTASQKGVTVSIAPELATLDAGKTLDFTVCIEVDNRVLPFPTGGSLSLSGRIVFSGASVTIRVPWSFIKAGRFTLQYDRPDPLTVVGLGTGKTGYILQSARRPGTPAFDLYAPPGKYDLFVSVLSSDSGRAVPRLIFLPRAELSDSISYDLKESMATSEITYASTDATGTPLRDIGRVLGICTNNLVVNHPLDASLPFVNLSSSQTDGEAFRVFISPLPSGIVLTGSEVCWGADSTLYVAQHGPIEGDRSRLLQVDASSWQRIPLRLVARDGLANPVVQFGWAVLQREAGWPSVTPFYRRVPLTGSTFEATIYMTPERHEATSTAGLLSLTHSAKGITTTAIDARIIRSTEDGVALWPYLTDGPAMVVANPGQLLSFGGGVLHPQVTMGLPNRSDGRFTYSFNWNGALGENRPLEAADATVVLRRPDGTTLAAGSSVSGARLDPDGVYEFESTLPFILGDGQAEARLKARFDSRLSDTAPPQLRLLRIENGDGEIGETLLSRGAGTLRFAAIDPRLDPVARSLTYRAVDAARTTVSWRLHETTLWHALPVTVEADEIANTADEHARLGHPPVGTLFASDLAALLREAAGAVDIRLHVEDPVGNAIDYTIAPALVVTGGRRHSVVP